MSSLVYQFAIGGLLFFGTWVLVEVAASASGRERMPRRWRLLFALLFLTFLVLQGSLSWA